MTITIDNKKIVSSQSEQNQSLCVAIKMNKRCFFIILLLMIALAILMGIFIIKIIKINKLSVKPKDNNKDKQGNFNRTIQDLNDLVIEKDKQIKELQQIIVSKQELSKIITIVFN